VLYRSMILAAALVVSACSTHHSPQDQAGGKILYVTDKESDLSNLMLEAITEAGRGRRIRNLKGPIRGYWTRRNWALDYWTTGARIHHASGVTESGKTVNGYYPEVTGSGSMIIRGPRFDKKLYKILIHKMGTFAPEVTVKNLKRRSYQLTREQWHSHNSPSPPATSPGPPSAVKKGAIEKRLEALENLKSAGKITDTEYRDLRTKILKDL
jgi:hypothetical protein